MKRYTLFTTIAALLSITCLQAQVIQTQKKVVIKDTSPLSQALSQVYTEKIDLENIDEWLCPRKLLRGDREFDGNGPRVKCEVKLRIGEDSTSLWAEIYFWAQETVHDWSTTEGNWSKKVYDAPYGQKIVRIRSATASRTSFISPAAGFQFLFPGEDVNKAMKTFFDGSTIASGVLAAHGFPSPATATKSAIGSLISVYSAGNTVIKVPATEGELVQFFHIVGDTGGEDISKDNNCNDDTRIVKIEFFPVQVDVKKTGK